MNKSMQTNLTKWNREDRDLLIELRTEMKAVRTDIQSLQDGVTGRLSNLEQNAVSKIQFEDHEERLRATEVFMVRVATWGSVGMLAIGVVEFGLQYWFSNR